VSIHQLADRCWELTDPADDERTPHYGDEAAAQAALKELRDEEPDTKASIRLLGSACWVTRCDGDCEAMLDEEDEGYIFHHESIADALETVRAYEWRTVGDSVFCPADAPDGAELPLSAAEQEAAGQLPLPGVIA
jgi:hypothetical protein